MTGRRRRGRMVEGGSSRPLTYADAGVDVAAKDAAAKSMVSLMRFAREGAFGRPFGGVGHYAGMVEFGEFALVLATDGVGTKLEIANAMRKWDTVGIDCVAMNVNDVLCVGAEPIAFVDYLAVERPDAVVAGEIAKGLNEGARQSNMTIVGGETAVLPDLVRGFDLAGTVLAFVRKDRVVDGRAIEPGDAIVGVASSGVHSNGYSLVRRVVRDAGLRYDEEAWPGARLGDVLLAPTRIYVKAVLDLLAAREVAPVRGIAHVTGSGLMNLPRLRRDVRYVIDRPIEPPRIFDLVQELGRVEDAEMYRTFNMGMGLAVVVPADAADAAVRVLSRHHPARVVGHVVEGVGVTVPSKGVEFLRAKADFQ